MSFSGYSPPTSKSRHRWPCITGMALSGLLIVGCADPTTASDAASGAESASSATDTAISASPPAASTDAVSVAPAPTPASAAESSPDAQAALGMLATLPIKGRAPKTGYDRDLFGQAWTDDVDVEFGHNGCDTRNDILRRDLTAITLKSGSNGCVVQTGTLADTYTGTTINFVRGADTSNAVQIEHIVALSNAFQTGAQQLDLAARANFANDPRNLQAVDGPANQQKGDGDAATWLPSNKSYRCTYVSRQVEVKAAYGLWVTPPEHEAIVRVLGDCGGSAPVAEQNATAPMPAEVPAAPVPSNVTYRNCAAVRAAGAAPIRAGEPGFSTMFDGDGDGVGCE